MADSLRSIASRYILLAIALWTIYHFIVPVVEQITGNMAQVYISALGGR